MEGAKPVDREPLPTDLPAPFAESEVSFRSGDGAVTLAGTLAASPRDRSAPAVVLVSGTGPIDRDVTVLRHKLFRVLARSLARAGIASLRFDKRGIGKSGGDFASAGPDDFVADVLGAVSYLVEHEGFAGERTGLVGHSEGGMVALTAASRERRVPFCVLMASPLLSGVDNLARSFALIARGAIVRDSEFDRHVADLTMLVEIARGRQSPDRDARALEIAERLSPRIFNERTSMILGADSLSGAEFVSLLSSACLETSLTWEPERIVPLVACPALLVYATMDVQAPARESIEAAHALLGDLGKDDWEIREVADMNHAFQRCKTGMPDEYAAIDEVMDDEAVDEVAAWINAAVGA